MKLTEKMIQQVEELDKKKDPRDLNRKQRRFIAAAAKKILKK